MIAFIGVRISWLILARKAVRSRLPASAASFASLISRVRAAISSSRRACSSRSFALRRSASTVRRWKLLQASSVMIAADNTTITASTNWLCVFG